MGFAIFYLNYVHTVRSPLVFVKTKTDMIRFVLGPVFS